MLYYTIGPRPIKPYIYGVLVNLDDERNSLEPHLTLYDQLGDIPILGAIVGRGVARSQFGAEVPNLRQKFPL